MEPEIEAHITRFLAMLDTAFRRRGEDGLPERLRGAVRDVPRHRFVHRFQADRAGPVEDFAAERHLAAVYSDRVLAHFGPDDAALDSTNSQPSYVLWLLHRLGLEPGHRALEIGSGSGWLAAVIGRLVGDGSVVGVEILADLARRSRGDLAALGIANVAIVEGDGSAGHAAGAAYDRAVITAAVWDPPAALFEQVAEGGRLLLPIALAGGAGRDCHVAVLRRDGDRFRALEAVPGRFVRFTGPGQERGAERRRFDELPFWPGIGATPTSRRPLSLGARDPARFAGAAYAFRLFLGQTEPGFTVFDDGAGDDLAASSFGLVDAAAGSVAVCRPGMLLGYGSPEAVRRLDAAYRRWTALGMPGPAAFELEVVRAGQAPKPGRGLWVETRGTSALVWRLASDRLPGRNLRRSCPDDAFVVGSRYEPERRKRDPGTPAPHSGPGRLAS
ncbi:protein-L-isoaspartate(D-aspartate) O-methyltransferase [Inquilinus ginsengisoli]|uniref:protein-L-isoaspartate O-methyltransferase family protein n=1 Tax=Inquilinus ginsengisoli TaxID=363840 RepID=UPI003D23E661